MYTLHGIRKLKYHPAKQIYWSIMKNDPSVSKLYNNIKYCAVIIYQTYTKKLTNFKQYVHQ